MLLVLSPAKTLDFDSSFATPIVTKPSFFEESLELVELLASMKQEGIASLLKISDALAQLNYQRYQAFSPVFSDANSKSAITCFRGDVYKAFSREDFTEQDYLFAQKHLRILSGLYGVLKPLDAIQPYRLEMGTKLANSQGKNLYDYWRERVTNDLRQTLEADEQPILLNLASKEYMSVIDQAKLGFPIINITFKEERQGVLKVIAIQAKRARGVMANWIIKNKIDHPAKITEFTENGYQYQPQISSSEEYIFVR